MSTTNATQVLALDQGTTSSRAIVFSRDGKAVSSAQQEFPQLLPQPGHVEHNPEDIWTSQLQVAREALAAASGSVASIGVTNQRETTVLWERDSGEPIANAIVWQSRVTAPVCEELRAGGYEETLRHKTGLLLDPYFSGTKVKYLLDKHDSTRARAERGEILFGTVDSFLIWRLTGGKRHVTDVSNASRTMLFDLKSMDWDEQLLQIFGVPQAMLPEIVDSSAVVGETDEAVLGQRLPIAGIAGDQQAATFGQGCFDPGSAKNTYGTGCFMLLNTGDQPVVSQNRLLTTVGWRLNGKTTYCLEGSVFVAGAVVQWLRDGLGVIKESADVERLAATVEDSGGVYFVPGFVGLGAPYWDPYARGAIHGLTRGTTAGHLARAAVESMAFQSWELLEAMQADYGQPLRELKVDGGAATNDALMQFQADLLDLPVLRPRVFETTALGAAYLAGLTTGVWQDLGDIRDHWVLGSRFDSTMPSAERELRCKSWRKAVERSRAWQSQ